VKTPKDCRKQSTHPKRVIALQEADPKRSTAHNNKKLENF
jgi:hypothetical protein